MSTDAAPKLVFVIPVRHPGSVSNWAMVHRNLSETAQSIANQNDPNWQCVVVANEGADLPALPGGFEVRYVDFSLPDLPARADDEEAFYDAVRLDKGRRILHGIADADDHDYVMVVDYDDWVSARLASWVQGHLGNPGWYFRKGYVHDGSQYILLHKDFSELCGTSHIVRKDLLGIAETWTATSETVIKRNLGSHIFLRHDLSKTNNALAELPFPGAVYRVDYGSSNSSSEGVLQTYVPKWKLRKRPLEFVSNAMGLRIMTRKIRSEFKVQSPNSR